MTLDAAGNLYGATAAGGLDDGTLYEITASGLFTVLFVFDSNHVGCCGSPTGPLTLNATGTIFGTTSSAGPAMAGTIFSYDETGENLLYSFTGGTDGGNPLSGVALDSDGNLYGTTYSGGLPNSSGGCGVVYKLDPSGNETVLYSFTGGADGGNPEAGVILDAQGNIYGTTLGGGDLTACPADATLSEMLPAGCGVVFEVSSTGIETVLHTFSAGPDGSRPYGGLAADANGNLYGTTSQGGEYEGGVVFKVEAAAR